MSTENNVKKAEKTIFICATHRSGSTLLCNMLRKTKLAGTMGDFFALKEVNGIRQKLLDEWNMKFHWIDRYLERLLQEKVSRNNVFSAKMMYPHLELLLRQLRRVSEKTPEECSDLELIQMYFPNPYFIYNQRRNKVRQAISYEKAYQTKSWINLKKRESGDQLKKSTQYDYESISKHVTFFAECENGWENFFNQHSVEPYQVIYEDFIEDKEATIRAIFDYLNIEVPDNFKIPEPGLQKQANATSEEWYRQFISDLGITSELEDLIDIKVSQ